jgi:hypothetical protein
MESASWSNSNSPPTSPDSSFDGDRQRDPARFGDEAPDMLDSPPSEEGRMPDVDEGAVMEEGDAQVST